MARPQMKRFDRVRQTRCRRTLQQTACSHRLLTPFRPDFSSRQPQADQHGKRRIQDDERVVVFADALRLAPLCIFRDGEIQPALRVCLCLVAVDEMHHEHQPEKDGHEQDCRRKPEQEVVAQQHAEEDEDLGDLEPRRLQRMPAQKGEIDLDFTQDFVHGIPSFVVEMIRLGAGNAGIATMLLNWPASAHPDWFCVPWLRLTLSS